MKFLIIALLMTHFSAQASHWIDCDLKAEVIQIEKINRLNQTTVLTRNVADPSETKTDERSTIILLKINEIIQNERFDCRSFSIGQEIKLTVKVNESDKYTQGEILNMNYKNIGNRNGSQVTWTVL